MNRRKLFASTAGAALATAFAGPPLSREAAAAAAGADPRGARSARRPNILVILVDDGGYSDASTYGGEIFTPNIARLANQGVQFDNFHVSPYCAPTRAMLLTGADNHRVGLGNMSELLADNQFGKPGYEGVLNGNAVTIATLLRDAGYHTYMAGKWHLGKAKDRLPAAQGFEQSVALAEGGADNWEKKSYTPGYKTVHYYENFNEIELPPDFYSTRFYTDKLLSYIDKNAADGKPFFGYLALQAVHQPVQAPEDYIRRYATVYDAGWSALRETRYARQVDLGLMPPGLKLQTSPMVPDWNSLSPETKRRNAKAMAVYAGMLEYVDMSIGRILDHLERKGMLDDTLVLYMTDNGGEAAVLQNFFPDYYAKNFNLSYERMGLKGSYVEIGPGWAMATGAPLSNFKGSVEEGGVRAPLIVSYPKSVPIGRRTDAFAYVLDVVPTLLDFAGVRPRSALGGRSMAPLLSGRSKNVHAPGEMVFQEVAGGAAVYFGDYKLERVSRPFGDMKWRLYDLRRDPTEANDIAAANPKLFKMMLAGYAQYVKRDGVIEVPNDYDIAKQLKKNMAKKAQ